MPYKDPIVHAFSSHLDNSNSLFYGLTNTSINVIQYIQNCTARVLTYTVQNIFSRYSDCMQTPFATHSLSYSIQDTPYHIQSTPWSWALYISDLIHTFSLARTLRSSDRGLLLILRHKLSSFGGRAFYIAAPTLWNYIPKHIHDLSSLQVFKTLLKISLFSSCFSDPWLYDLILGMHVNVMLSASVYYVTCLS